MPHWDRRTGPPPTIAAALEHGDTISVHCWNPGCHREGALDLPALAARYGRDLDLDRIRAMLRCTECGKKSQPGGYPYGGTHRTIIRLAATAGVTPNLGHLLPRGNVPAIAPIRKRQRRVSDFADYDEASSVCGRYKLSDDPETIRANMRLLITPNLPPRYNIAPTQSVPVVRLGASGHELSNMRWGLVPFWSKEIKGPPLINARSETIAEKPAFRDAFRKRRCLIPADAYFEWTGDRSPKQPWLISLTSGKPFAFAGIWAEWMPKEPNAEPLLSTAMATTTATDSLAFIHDRMPVILTDRAEQDAWLNPESPVDRLQALLRPYPGDQMRAFKVGRAVSNVRNDSPECIEPI